MIETLTEGSTKEQIIETVAQPYPSDRGSVNEQYIYDLAVLARFGLDETDVVEIITHKMLSVPRSAYRDARQIARDFGSSLRHLERKNVPINTKPLFSPELVLERI